MSSRAFDIILLGATGFTGQLVAEYLSKNAQCRWAMAGRNMAKLAAVKDALGSTAAKVSLIKADSMDQESLDELTQKTRVIISTVGPYWQLGSLLVESCVSNCTHYVDLTGEIPWVREMIDAHHVTAREKSVKIVHFCGFDSIPSDLGVLVLQNAVRQEHPPLKNITFYIGPTKGGVSGGTIASMVGTMSRVSDPNVRRVLGNPYAINPNVRHKGKDGRDQMGVRWDADLNAWTAPFFMASVNSRVVRRSHALNDMMYGSDFQYQEVTAFPKGVRGWMMSASLTAALAGFVGLMALPPSRWFMKRFILPKPGEGPSQKARENGYFRALVQGASETGALWHCLVAGNKDPGYGQTAVMLAESALALVHNFDELPPVYGVVTPASALGMPLVERLRMAGMVFQPSKGVGSFSIK